MRQVPLDGGHLLREAEHGVLSLRSCEKFGFHLSFSGRTLYRPQNPFGRAGGLEAAYLLRRIGKELASGRGPNL